MIDHVKYCWLLHFRNFLLVIFFIVQITCSCKHRNYRWLENYSLTCPAICSAKFMYNVCLVIMHQSFVATAAPPPQPLPPHLRGWVGESGLMCGTVTFWVPPQYRVSARLAILRRYTPVEFTVIKNWAMTLSRSPLCRAFSRAVMDEKSSSPLFHIGGGGGGGGSGYKWQMH